MQIMDYIADILRFIFFLVVGVTAYKYGQSSDKNKNYEALNDRLQKAKAVSNDVNNLSDTDVINKLHNKDYK